MAAKSSASQRRRKRMRSQPEEEPEFQVAPMVDVLLVLMLFFMSITTTEILKKEKNLNLPDASNAGKDDEKKNEVTVNVSWDAINNTAGFTMDGIRYPTADAMAQRVRDVAAKKKSPIVLIRADKSTQYSNVSDLMDALGKAGIARVGFGAIAGGKKNATQVSTH